MMVRYTDINTGNNLLDESLENYLMHGFEPGGFLTSVLANDLFMAVGRADHWNQDILPQIVDQVLYKMPSISWGSYSAVKDWCADKDDRRSQYAEYKKEQTIISKLEGSHQ
jgi:hypothetical protein